MDYYISQYLIYIIYNEYSIIQKLVFFEIILNRVFYCVRMPELSLILPSAFYQLLTIDVVDASRDTPVLIHISRSPTYKDSHHSSGLDSLTCR